MIYTTNLNLLEGKEHVRENLKIKLKNILFFLFLFNIKHNCVSSNNSNNVLCEYSLWINNE